MDNPLSALILAILIAGPALAVHVRSLRSRGRK